MLFPDVDMDENYNVNFLGTKDAEFIKGFEYALDCVKNLFENNLDVYEEELNDILESGETGVEGKAYAETPGLYHILHVNCEIIVDTIDDWIYRERNEIVTSMIDDMNDEEHETNKAEYMKNHPDADFYDTRDFKEISKRNVRYRQFACNSERN